MVITALWKVCSPSAPPSIGGARGAGDGCVRRVDGDNQVRPKGSPRDEGPQASVKRDTVLDVLQGEGPVQRDPSDICPLAPSLEQIHSSSKRPSLGPDSLGTGLTSLIPAGSDSPVQCRHS